MDCIPRLNVHDLLTVDLLHEFELGVWKALFSHILRIIAAHSPEGLHELDRRCVAMVEWILTCSNIPYISQHRYRLVPSFAKDTIRKFSNNASQMKNLAATNFEDLLQVR